MTSQSLLDVRAEAEALLTAVVNDDRSAGMDILRATEHPTVVAGIVADIAAMMLRTLCGELELGDPAEVWSSWLMSEARRRGGDGAP